MTVFHLFLHSYSFRFHYLHKPGFDVFRFIETAVEGGFTGVNISANGANYRHLSGMAAEHVGRVAEALDQRDLLRDLETSGTDPDHLKTLLDVAQALGAAHLRTYTRHRGNTGQIVAATIEDLRVAAASAENAGVKILLENHEEFTGAEVAEILRAVDNPWVAALYDYGNSQMLLEHPLHALEAMKPFVLSAHLKDHMMLAGQDAPDGSLSVQGVPVGSGALPIVEITRRLLAAGLDRIAFENVWAYRSPVTDDRGAGESGGVLGEGAFVLAQAPFDDAICLPDTAALERDDPSRLVELEWKAYETGLSWLRGALSGAGLATVGQANPADR